MLDVTDVKPTLPAVKDRAPGKGLCLNDLIAIARDAHLGVVSAFTNALDRAIACGCALNQMEDAGLVRRVDWAHVYKRCQMGLRQAQRYKKLARLVAEKTTYKSFIDGCTIEEAIKKLAPPKPRARSGNTVAHQPAPPAKKSTFADIVAAWMAASAADRTRALDAIGWNALRGAIPQSWHAVLAAPVIDVTPAPVGPETATPEDLSIPGFLNRNSELENP
jgi:hypothetical protein